MGGTCNDRVVVLPGSISICVLAPLFSAGKARISGGSGANVGRFAFSLSLYLSPGGNTGMGKVGRCF